MHFARRLVLAAGFTGALLLVAYQPYRVQVSRYERTVAGGTLTGAECSRRAASPTALGTLVAQSAGVANIDVRVEHVERDGARLVASASWLVLLTAVGTLAVGHRWRVSAARQAVAATALGVAVFAGLDLSFAPLSHRADGFASFSCTEILRP